MYYSERLKKRKNVTFHILSEIIQIMCMYFMTSFLVIIDIIVTEVTIKDKYNYLTSKGGYMETGYGDVFGIFEYFSLLG